MNNLPKELHFVIASFCSYRDILLLRNISKYFKEIINAEEILYNMISHKTNIIYNDNIYTDYYRGKSYDYSIKGNDVYFVIPLGEIILYQNEVNFDGIYSPEYIIVTLNNCYNFIVYEFKQEV